MDSLCCGDAAEMVSYPEWPLHRGAQGKGSCFLHQENKDLMTWFQAERKTCKKGVPLRTF